MTRFAIALAVLLASSSASAGITFDDSDGGAPVRKATTNSQTKSRMLVQFFQNDIMVWEYTPCFQSCSVTPPPVAYNSFATQLVGFDPAREQLVSYSCGAGEDLGNYRCKNAEINVHLKVKVGDVIIRSYSSPEVGNPQIRFAPGLDINRRLYFAEDHNFWWDEGLGVHYPAGNFDLASPVLPFEECKPRLLNEFTAMHVEAMPTPNPDVIVEYAGTSCQYNFVNDGDHDATVTASTGGSCVLTEDDEECVIEVPFGADHVVFTSESNSSGFEASLRTSNEAICNTAWNWGHNVCSLNVSKQDRDVKITYLPTASTPSVTVTAGPNQPVDRRVALGSTDNPVLQFTVTPSTNTSIGRMILHGTGTGHHNPDLTDTHVYVDANSNGVHDAGETEVVKGAFSNTNDNGNYKGDATLNMAYALTGPTTFVVTVDIADELSAGADMPFAPWSLILVAAIPVVVLYRRRRLAIGLASVMLVIGVVYACGGGGTQDDDDDDQQQGDSIGGGDNGSGDNDTTTDDGPIPGPDEATLGFTIKGFAGHIQEGVPLVGATLTVHR